MKRNLVYGVILLAGFIFFVFGYVRVREKNAVEILSQKAVINQTNLFFNQAITGEIIEIDTMEKRLAKEYIVEKFNDFHLKVFPKRFSANDFYGFEIKVDSISRKIAYIGIYKP